MSWRAISSDPCSSSYAHRSARIPLVNSTLPAPMIVTLATVASLAPDRAGRRPCRVTFRRDRLPGGEPLDRQVVRGRTARGRRDPSTARVRAGRRRQGPERGARGPSFGWGRAGRGDPARTRGEVARGGPAGRGDRRRVRLDPRGESVVAVGRRPERWRPDGVLRARPRRAGGRVGRARGGGERAVPAGELAHDLGVDAPGAAGRWVPRPAGGGSSGRHAGRARRR